ncbi:M14 family metallopeptidase [Aeromicrobium chenweiae]|uniref:Peptidase M14 n=1 Tax=Aeromicrobium chenweiae TaxID=2079793 RepID=A0A2S0WKE8_9ACTN|nr:M14 family metallopeptidase [Aeromicrobium chenweiae]AWB91818.1 peptidase M14 [Aeromicrobium chenweiae]TGN32662.1 peptidase M14 [Aeromicrobium chenweiae]
MRNSRALIGVTGLALATTCVLSSTSVAASAVEPSPSASSPAPGRGPSTATTVDPLSKAQVVRRAAETAVAGDPIDMPTSYPYQPDLKIFRPNADDAAHSADLIGHPEIAPKLLDLMETSDRVSAQVVGQSTEGRDLYLVTVTAPETEDETAQQAAWKAEIKSDPAAAAKDTALINNYKTPVWISNNIHGNEWEGTDAALKYIDYLATAPIGEVRSILKNNRLYFSPSLNPDGRTNSTRATALGLDPNRDMITNSTPETKSFIRQAQAIQPIYAADFHGYTSVLQMEPTGPPHGSNYEYDLTMPHNYALALKVEKDVVDAAIPGNTYLNTTTGRVVNENTSADTAHIKIPYRDTPDGWDDFPPIFTAQYNSFYGAAASTVELPKSRNGTPSGRQSPANAAINSAVAYKTMSSIVDYMNTAGNARDMIKNQIETFRRGVAGEPKDNLTVAKVKSVPGPTQWQPLWDVVDDQDAITLPRAYVIPVGANQRSKSDATRLVDQLLAHDIEVGTLNAAATVDGTTYPKGSYVVDMHQPLRGLANSLLDLGEDISDKVPSMYDISAWSYSYTWGATVDKVGLTTQAPIGATTPITAATPQASIPAKAGYLTFDVAGVADYQALNSLLEEDERVSMLADGSVVVGPESYDTAKKVASTFDIDVEPATKADLDALDDAATKPLKDLTIAYVGTQDDKLSLQQLGFDDLVPVTANSLNADPQLIDDVDVLWVGTAFSTTDRPASGSTPAVSFAPAREAVQSFLDEGGALLGRTNAAFNAASSFGLLSGTVVSGNGSGNGIVAVDTPANSVLAPYKQDSAFIYPAYSFTSLGENVKTEQTYAEKPLLAGHWRASGAGATNGPSTAAGQASVVSSENATTGAKSMVFGTSVFFRTHTKGGMTQAARGLFWAGPEGEAVVAPGGSSVAITSVGKVTYPGAASVTVRAADAADKALDGTVTLRAGAKVLATGATRGGKVTLKVSGLRPGSTSVVATFTPASPSFASSTSAPAAITVAKASSKLSLKAKKWKNAKKARVTVKLTVPGVSTAGSIVITDKGKKVRTVRVDAGKSRAVTLKLKKGTHQLRAVFSGNGLVTSSKSKTVKVKIS